MSQSAHIVGIVEVRQGDGTMQVTQGPIGVYTTEIDATLSWSDGNTYAVVAMPLTDYERHLATGSIRVDPLPPA